MKYKTVASKVIAGVDGHGNSNKVTYCAQKLHFNLEKTIN